MASVLRKLAAPIKKATNAELLIATTHCFCDSMNSMLLSSSSSALL